MTDRQEIIINGVDVSGCEKYPLNFIKNNLEKEQSMEDFCAAFRLALISKLEQTGVKYDPTLEHEWSAIGNNTTDRKKFFAFKKSVIPTEQEILDALERVYGIILEYMKEFGSIENLTFNIIKIEGLIDREAFSDLVRGILVVKVVKDAG